MRSSRWSRTEGVDAVTHRRVADVAGLPLASTTYWFESKEHLLTAALERAAERDIERLEAFLRRGAGGSERPARSSRRRDSRSDRGRGPTSRSLLLATYALMLEAARRPALREATQRWTDAYWDALSPLLAAAGSRDPRSSTRSSWSVRPMACSVSQLATGDASDLAPQLRRLAEALVKA